MVESIRQYFSGLPDPRCRRGRRHRLDELVIIAILAVTHTGPESCGHLREEMPEASTGVHAGWVLKVHLHPGDGTVASLRSHGMVPVLCCSEHLPLSGQDPASGGLAVASSTTTPQPTQPHDLASHV